MFGPFDSEGAFWAIVGSLAHAALVLALGSAIIYLARVRPMLSASLMLVLVTCDLALANARYVFTVPQALFETKPEVLAHIEAEERAQPVAGAVPRASDAALEPAGLA